MPVGNEAFHLDLILHRIAQEAELVGDAAEEDGGTGFHGWLRSALAEGLRDGNV